MNIKLLPALTVNDFLGKYERQDFEKRHEAFMKELDELLEKLGDADVIFMSDKNE